VGIVCWGPCGDNRVTSYTFVRGKELLEVGFNEDNRSALYALVNPVPRSPRFACLMLKVPHEHNSLETTSAVLTKSPYLCLSRHSTEASNRYRAVTVGFAHFHRGSLSSSESNYVLSVVTSAAEPISDHEELVANMGAE
jgi:hypothetical protein